MSVTVADLMKLPSMRQAQVIGGQNGLNKVVCSISVLESVDPGNLVDGVFQTGEFFGSEIVITGFVNCPDNVELQCANIRRLAEGGEVGLILFYVGFFIKQIDQRLIDLANELDFVLIQMPSTLEMRYGEVISDVTEAIYKDRVQNESIVADILANISKIPEHKRTVATVLKMLSDRLHVSIILTDSSVSILNIAAWPRSMDKNFPFTSSDLKKFSYLEKGSEITLSADNHLYHMIIHPDGGDRMHLFLLKVGNPISLQIQEQVEDTVRICVNIWGREHSAIVIRELIKSIIQDDPIKMHRLSEVFHIDIFAAHDMWILECSDKKKMDTLRDMSNDICHILAFCTKLQFGDLYDGKLIMFSSMPLAERDAGKVWERISVLFGNDSDLSFVWCHGLQTTTDVREAYQCCCDYWDNARKIYPAKKFFRLGDILFAKDCCQIIQTGEESMKPFMKSIELLQQCSEEWNPVDTMASHLLDNDASITKTSEVLYLHKNTIKYRLKIITDMLGFPPNKMPEGWHLYQALAIHRLLQ